MFSYIMLGTNNPEISYQFYAPLMDVLSYPLDGRSEKGAAWVRSKIIIPQDYVLAFPLIIVMVALNAPSVDIINKLYTLALENGGEDDGPPGYRPHYGDDFYSAYVRDPDNNKIAFVFYDPAKK